MNALFAIEAKRKIAFFGLFFPLFREPHRMPIFTAQCRASARHCVRLRCAATSRRRRVFDDAVHAQAAFGLV